MEWYCYRPFRKEKTKIEKKKPIVIKLNFTTRVCRSTCFSENGFLKRKRIAFSAAVYKNFIRQIIRKSCFMNIEKSDRVIAISKRAHKIRDKSKEVKRLIIDSFRRLNTIAEHRLKSNSFIISFTPLPEFPGEFLSLLSSRLFLEQLWAFETSSHIYFTKPQIRIKCNTQNVRNQSTSQIRFPPKMRFCFPSRWVLPKKKKKKLFFAIKEIILNTNHLLINKNSSFNKNDLWML